MHLQEFYLGITCIYIYIAAVLTSPFSHIQRVSQFIFTNRTVFNQKQNLQMPLSSTELRIYPTNPHGFLQYIGFCTKRFII